ncbi:hypothetical protein HETIRDRAFT_163056 [Heterobasidion irregulare TC 32-1]|uniref:Macro domain-containing protein n=1 Tax=Heterobasidion irregulare (strain TC 32-1) TaxID=747525 RepID=W4KC30_HETIT|nr:uncharacterized protein HETIRDRAFT_163056 [Heterobasidion irregulare TC 32-1]ETW83279.1 hypothetical protein HETIRDRAFT_163056 [Heterobasidion irregulare TC 32-1]
MSRGLSFRQIPTIGDLYQRGVLRRLNDKNANATKERFPSVARLLDRVSLYQGDITKLDVHAIVNAANGSLLDGDGADGAIHRAAGPQLLKECRTLKGCQTGDAKITRGYNLPARHVIHTVGPVYSGTAKVQLVCDQLASCYTRSLHVAAHHSLTQIAFPAISTGVHNFPIMSATHIALNAVRLFLESEEEINFERVVTSSYDRTLKINII